MDDNDTKAAIGRLARRLWPYLKNKAAQIRLGEVASIRKESPVSLLLNQYFPEAIRAVALEKQVDKRQRMRLRGCKFLKTRKGKVAEKKPSELSSVDLYFWFRKQVYRNVCESLLRGGDALDRTKAIKKENRDGEVSYEDVEEFSLDDSWLGNSVPEETDYVPDRDLLDFTDSLKRLCDRADLTRREKKVLKVSKHFSLPTSQTAKKLSISPTAARVSKHRIMRKLHLASSS